MGWRITADYIVPGNPFLPKGEALSETTVPFRLIDDDGYIYYRGEISHDWLYGDAEKAFAPLDWAQANAGCTEMHIFENGEWKQL